MNNGDELQAKLNEYTEEQLRQLVVKRMISDGKFAPSKLVTTLIKKVEQRVALTYVNDVIRRSKL